MWVDRRGRGNNRSPNGNDIHAGHGNNPLIYSYADQFLLHRRSPWTRPSTRTPAPPFPSTRRTFSRSLHQQWVRESATPSARIELSQWVNTRPELVGAESFAELKALTFCEPDAVLSVLLHAHQAGSALAGSTLIEFMRPKLTGMQKYARVANGVSARAAYADRTAATLHAFWETISTYRGTHRGIAAQLALNTLNKITATTVVLDLTVDDTYFHIANDEKACRGVPSHRRSHRGRCHGCTGLGSRSGNHFGLRSHTDHPVIHERRRCRYRPRRRKKWESRTQPHVSG